ncbi:MULTISPECIES: YkyA family protein [Halolactibacillus]|uniref:Putative cell-wall binding lipoprotein n=1 Tax=Halolactibacillus miurensis TaxID=306541 RepID=A0A1I6R5P4_9BACI|nr:MULTISPECIES: YkyA family protein [Halolactibacillus]SFS59900.1 Putative cell-wall binding lipoprotein [Halolactibacillus miurensis]
MRLKLVLAGLLSAVMLTACSGESTQEEIYQHLEKSVELEVGFVEQQQPISELEQQEQEIYQDISDLGIDQYEEIKTLADEAITTIEERETLTGNERASIDNAKEEFDKVVPLVAELEEAELKTAAETMIEEMNQRYDAFVELNEAYKTSLTLDKELYELLKQEDLEEATFSEQVDEVNAQYQVVVEKNQLFNEETDAFNEAKRQFYEQSDLNISYEE